MAVYDIPSKKTVHTTAYRDFSGTDFSSDDMNVSQHRFADSRNIMLDKNGYPEKRYGYTALNSALGEKVHSMKEVEVGGEKFLAVHTGSKLYRYIDGEMSEINSYKFKKYSAVVTTPENSDRIRITVSADVGSEVPMAVKDIMVIKLPSSVSEASAKSVLDEAEYFDGYKSFTVSGSSVSLYNLLENGNFTEETEGFYTFGNGVEVCDGFILSGRNISVYSGVEQFVSAAAENKYYVCFTARVADTVKKAVRTDYFDSNDNHLGKYIFTLSVSDTESVSALDDCESDIFSYNDMLWIVSEKGMMVFDGLTFEDAERYAHIPVTSALRNYHTIRYRYNEGTSWETQKYTDPGGFVESVNLLTKKRINTFALDDFMTKYHHSIYAATSTLYTDAEISRLVKVEFLNEDGSWSDVTDYARVQQNSVIFNTGSLKDAPYITEMPIENVKVTFECEMEFDKVHGCRFGTFYGEGNDSRLFLSGNKKYPNYEWYSEYSDLTYFPDLNYCVVGSESAIVGYSKIGDSLVIFKEKSPDDSAVYMQTPGFTSDGKPYFMLKQCYSEVGAIGNNGIAQVGGLPHFVTDEGIFAIVSNVMNSEKSVVNVSFYADSVLKKESAENAVLYRYDGMLFCGFGDRCYVFRSGNAPYDVFLWESIPATHFAEFENCLYFGTSDGRLCRFNTDVEDLSRYNDYPSVDGEPQAVVAYFTTRLDEGCP